MIPSCHDAIAHGLVDQQSADAGTAP